MRIRVPRSSEFGFLLVGVIIILVAWGLNLEGTLSGQETGGHASEDLYIWLGFMLQGLAVAAVGVVYVNFRAFLQDPILTKRYVVGFLLLADGGFHLLALNQHLTESFSAAVFFAVVSPLQLAAGLIYARLPRRLDMGALLLTAFLIASFVATRIFALPPTNLVEEVDPLGVISKFVELITLWTLISLMRQERSKEPPGHTALTVNSP